MGKYFGTDGIRGKANEKLTASLALKVGESLALIDEKDVIIAGDTRVSTDMLISAVCAGALSVGKNVILAGKVSTPCLMFASRHFHTIGIMITASHNPYYDNGIKVVKYGKKILNDEQALIENYIDGNITINKSNIGEIKQALVTEEYIKYLKSLNVKSDLKIAIDAANGATYKLAEAVFSRYGAYITNNCPDGYNINNNVGSTHLESIINTTKGKYDLGFAFDGDGDRIMVVDKNGYIYDGDKILYVLANYFAKKNKLNKKTVVLTKMCNLGIINSLKDINIDVDVTDVGDKYVLESMEKNDFSLGGENSGHIITPYSNTGDGILVGLLILMVLDEEKKTLEELTKTIEMYHDKMVNIPVNNKAIINNDELNNRIKEIENDLGKYGKVILRASGTENLIRVSVMAKDQEVQLKYLDELVSMVNNLNQEG